MNMFDDYYQKAPEKIQEIVDSYETSTILGDIARKYHVDIAGSANPIIGRLTGRTLVGMTHPKNFIPNLKKELGLSLETAQAIAKEVNEKIFAHVKDILIETYRLQETTPIKNETPSKDYSTPPAMFEKKLQQSVLTASKQNTSAEKQNKNTTSPPLSKNDPYKELPE